MSELSRNTVETLTKHDIAEASDVIAEALQDEPGFVAVVPDPEKRRIVMHTLMNGVVRDGCPLGNVWIARSGPRIAGTAIWYAPGDYPMTTWRTLKMAPGMLSLLRLGPGRVRALGQMNENVEAHFPERPCWYLSALGVAPEYQGEGVGSNLMRTTLREVDRREEPAYLETGDERTVRFYERLGFEIREPAIHIAPPPGPTHWTMCREPQ